MSDSEFNKYRNYILTGKKDEDFIELLFDKGLISVTQMDELYNCLKEANNGR